MKKTSFLKYISALLVINLLFIITVLSTSIYNKFQNMQLLNDFKEHPFTVSNQIHEMNSQIDMIWDTLHANLYHHSDYRKTINFDFGKKFYEFELNLDKVSKIYLGPQKDIDDIKSDYYQIKKIINDSIDAYKDGDEKKAIILASENNSTAKYYSLKKDMNRALQFANNKAQNFITISNEQFQKNIKIFIFLVITSILFTIFVSYFLYTKISSSFETIANKIALIGSKEYFEIKRIHKNFSEFIQIENTLDKASIDLFHSTDAIKQKNKEIEKAQLKFQTIFEESLDGIVLMDPRTQHFLEFNRNAYEMYGYTKEEFSKLTPTDLDVIYDEENIKATQQNILKKGWDKFTTKHKTKDGSLKDIIVSVRVIKLNNAHLLNLTFHDITEQKLIEEENKQNTHELQTIFDFTQDGIAITDLDTHFLNFNNAYLEQTGYTKEELLTKSCIELTIKEDQERSKNTIAKVLQDGNISGYEKTCIRKDHSHLIVNMSIALLPDKKRLLVTTKNITQNKIFEEQSKLASMGEMIGNIAHQWRQPLSVISTCASSIAFKEEMKELNSSDIIPNMDLIVHQAEYLSKTIDDFKNFIKPSSIESSIDVKSLLEKTLSIVNPTLSNNFIETILDIDKEATIRGYENELIQSFINIINNTKDAINQNLSNETQRYLFISVIKEEKRVKIVFKDNAGGIEKSIQTRIFEPYFTTKHQLVGTGLGLSMTYKIVTQRHKGDIEVENATYTYKDEEYTGALFTLSFERV